MIDPGSRSIHVSAGVRHEHVYYEISDRYLSTQIHTYVHQAERIHADGVTVNVA